MILGDLLKAAQGLTPGQSLEACIYETPLGPMIALGNDQYIYLLEFLDKPDLQDQIIQFCKKQRFNLSKGMNTTLAHLGRELDAYFKGTLETFNTPIFLSGTDFQKSVWNRLLKIPHGTTIAYGKQAQDMGRPQSFRAVANANGCNRLSIIVPCHRVVRGDGTLGGYAGGLNRKSWLLDHERKKTA